VPAPPRLTGTSDNYAPAGVGPTLVHEQRYAANIEKFRNHADQLREQQARIQSAPPASGPMPGNMPAMPRLPAMNATPLTRPPPMAMNATPLTRPAEPASMPDPGALAQFLGMILPKQNLLTDIGLYR